MTNLQHYPEEWVDIPEFLGSYQINRNGIVKSFPKPQKSKSGNTFFKRERILNSKPGTLGYIYFSLKKDKITHYRKAHRLVAQVFISNPRRLECVNHKNGIKTDNRVENLEWCTKGYNSSHAKAIGLYRGMKGESNSMCLLKSIDVMEIYRNENNSSRKELAQYFGITPSNVAAIQRGKSWCHITGHIFVPAPVRKPKEYLFDGVSLSLEAWAAKIEVNKYALISRVKNYKWSIEKALTTPVKTSS